MNPGVGLNRIHFPVTALGPGRRVGIWLQGCSVRCDGCMSLDTWAPARRLLPIDELMDHIAPWLAEADGVTISGGEPFDQPEALHALLTALRTAFCGTILVYSGHPLDRQQERHGAALRLIDLLISGPYDATCAEPALLRGSSNQRVHCLSEQGAELWRAAEVAEGSPTVDVVLGENGELWLAGIPRPGDLGRLARGLARSGVLARTSAGRLRGTT